MCVQKILFFFKWHGTLCNIFFKETGLKRYHDIISLFHPSLIDETINVVCKALYPSFKQRPNRSCYLAKLINRESVCSANFAACAS